MPQHTKSRRFFKTTEIKLMQQLAAENQSQSFVAKLLNRDPGVIAQAALRYGIQFHAPTGRPKTVPREAILKRRAEASRRWRQRLGAKPKPRKPDKVTRFDDPRVLITEEKERK